MARITLVEGERKKKEKKEKKEEKKIKKKEISFRSMKEDEGIRIIEVPIDKASSFFHRHIMRRDNGVYSNFTGTPCIRYYIAVHARSNLPSAIVTFIGYDEVIFRYFLLIIIFFYFFFFSFSFSLSFLRPTSNLRISIKNVSD